MTKVYRFYNTGCLKCGSCEIQMVKVGPMVFCEYCHMDEFGVEDDEIDNKSKEYKKWLKKYKEGWDD